MDYITLVNKYQTKYMKFFPKVKKFFFFLNLKIFFKILLPFEKMEYFYLYTLQKFFYYQQNITSIEGIVYAYLIEFVDFTHLIN